MDSNVTLTHPSYINYLAIYDNLNQSFPLTVLVYMLFLCFYFLSLWTVADTHFIPILNAIVYMFDIPETIAGMTIIAFGNGAPDVFSIYTSFSQGLTRLGLGELLGASIMVSIMTVGIISIMRPAKLHWFAVNRDLGFFLGALSIFGFFLLDGNINLVESFILIMYYGFYMLFSVSVAYYFMDIVEEEVPLPPVHYPTSGDLEIDTAQNFEEEIIIPRKTAPRSPSELSFMQDPDFDAEYFLGNQSMEVANLLIKSCESDMSNTSLSSWQRRALPISSDVELNEDVLDFISEETDFSNLLHIELKQTIKILFPIYSNWKQLSFNEKYLAILQSPLILLLNLTIPVMDIDYITKCQNYEPVYPLPDPSTVAEEYRLHYPRILLIIQILFLPITNAFLQGVLLHSLFGYPLWLWALFAGVVMSFSLFLFFNFSPKSQPIDFKYFLSALGFYQSVSYFLMISDELVQLFKAIAFFTTIKPALLGLTLFALGNSLSEVVTNTSIAKYSSPIIAVSACYGGQLFNVIFGVGIAAAIHILSSGGPIILESISTAFWASYFGLFIGILASLIFFNFFSNYTTTRRFGIALILYAAFIFSVTGGLSVL